MMVRHNTPVPQEASDEPCHGRFLQEIAKAHAALVEQIMCDPEMPAAEEAQIMIHLGKLEYVARCGRHLN
jgi:hypothetical protein